MTLNIYLGYDSREIVAYHTFAQSIIANASGPVSIIPLKQDQLRAMRAYTRPVDTKAATEFSLTRFLVPYLNGYEGYAIFADCDMIAKADVYELVVHAQAKRKAVLCCQHDYVPKNAVKMDGQPNAAYPRKNWSSLMVFDCASCRVLTPEYVNTASPADLHRFAWCNDDRMGGLPLSWNWLVGEYEHNDNAKILHYTEGGPWFDAYRDVDHASDWYSVYNTLQLEAQHA